MNLSKFFKGLLYRVNHVILNFILTIASFFNHIRSFFHPNKILFQNPYKSEKVLLIALYEKGVLRNDIVRLLQVAKAKGLYVIGVNTQKLLSHDIKNLFDCYIERFNFGRDFGSYKAGFQHIFKNKYHEQCPRLLMINDSVYYESSRVPKFIDDLINTDKEVLGATENYEVEYHIGSFCISISNRILKHKKHMRYWLNFKNSDVRPTVIRRGEMGYSRCLKKLVLNADHFCVLYGVPFMATHLQKYEILNNAIKLIRRSNHLWAQIDLPTLWVNFISQHYLSPLGIGLNVKTTMRFDKTLISYAAVYDLMAMKNFFENSLKIEDDELLTKMIRFCAAHLIWMFRAGSQIHQCNAILVSIGLPLIKLDGFFRGPVAEEDVLLISEQMSNEQALELQALLFNKSYGGDTLIDWKLLLFNHGFI